MEDSEDDIAVIGIGCNFPGGQTLDTFWRVLLEGKNCAVDIPAERFDTSLWYDADSRKAGKTQTTKAALIEGFNELDHKFFGITEAEADLMDPQQKLLLLCTYRALEDAGLAMERISGSRTGVYIGLMNRDYEMLRSVSPTTITHYSATGTAMSVAANRISFTFNLTGPSFALDSACSSSLVAVHLACQAIKQGDCEMALCGGVSCIIEPRVFVALSKAKMVSPEGTSKPFSSRADGYGRGEGCGVVLLKPLKKATRDHNKIWGIISKTAVNQDGRSVSPITKPSMVQQEELLRQIYSQSDIANVQYVEAHGTGTPAGDPTEAGSIANVIAKARPPGSETLRIGSVKSNIGHTESAAGVAGLIKVLLMMKHQTIVPSVFYSEDSASVDMKALRISIPTKAECWETNGSEERMAGVNSFGFGGTNAHVIVREHMTTEVEQIPKGCPKILVISAASEKSFTLTITDTLQRLLNQPVDLWALTYTSACGRTHSRHKYRKAFLTSSLSDLQHQLTPFLETKVESFRPDMQVVFVFCGNGVAYRGMCKQLLRDVPVFRDTVTEVEKAFQRHKSIGLTKWLSGECGDLSKPDIVQPLLFAVQVGLANVLKTWGIKPDAVLGHSVGEVAAAHSSGLLSLEDAVKVLHHRSSLQSKVTGGKMLVVSNMAVEKIIEMLQVFCGKICVAAFNSPQSCTLSGDGDAIDVLHKSLRGLCTDKRLFLHVLDVPVAYHSHLMDPILDDIERSIGLLDANTMECKLLSTVTGGWYSEGDFCSGTYWAKNIREPVVFEQTLRAATKDKEALKHVVFVEIGPRRALQRNICETLGSDALVIHCAQPGRDYDALLSAAVRLFELGIDVDWHQLYKGYETSPAAFPVYQFETLKKSLNFGEVRRGDVSFACPPHAFTSPKHPNNKESVYVCNLAIATAPYLWEHKNNGASILPGAFYVDLAYASVMTSLGPNKLMSLLQLSLTFESLFTLTSDCHQLKVTLEHDEKVGSFKIQSDATTHASGTYVYSGCPPLLEEPNICIDTISQRCKLVMKRREIYSILSQAGFEYGSVFKQLHDVHFGEEFKEAVTTLQVLGELLEDLHDYFIHPVLLDYFLQMTAVVAIGQLTTRQGFPSAIGSISISGALQEKMILYLRATQDTPDFLEVCGCFSTTDGKVLVELKGVRISFMGNCSNVSESLFFHNEIAAIKDERESNNFKIKALVFGDKLGIFEGLRPHLHPESVSVENRDCWMPEELHNFLCRSLDTKTDFSDIIFIWAVEDLSHLSSEQMLDYLVTSCELFRQTVTALRKSRHACTVRVITYRASEMTVDHVSAGSVLSGMTRACAAEIPALSFQLIDLASVTREDICTLVHILNTCKKQEVMISRGRASATRIVRSPVEETAACRGEGPSVCLSNYALQTSDPYMMSHLSAVACDTNRKAVEDKSVEIQLMNLCTHSSDFFPVTTSHLNFGRTMYWNKHTSKNHSLLALDYSGIVTAVGKDVGDVRVGDHVAVCYPVLAAARVRIPEVACYCTRRLPFLKEAPCVSFYIVAYEILELMQPAVKQPRPKVVIVSSNPASAMIKVLALAANRSGWNVSTLQHFKGEQIHLDQGDAFVFLPPFERSWQLIHDHKDADRHIVFVCGDHMSADTPALQSDHMHIHNLDVRKVLQKARLRAQSRKVFKWMMSLGFESASLPLKREVFQLSSIKGPQTDAGSESYFTAATVQQVVLHHREPGCSVSGVPLLTRPGQLFKQGCVYIVSGGLSGLGLETVRFIVHHGGGFVATLSRSSPTDETQFKMDLLQKRFGVTIANVQCDVSVSQQVVDAVSEIQLRFAPHPIRGVFHSAAVLHDALIEGLDASAFRKVLRPKVSGALNLHYATLHSQLDFFVCYSSISSFIGNASQCNYAAANSFLDTFCHYRRNLGLAGQSINWGPLNLGLLLNQGHFQKFLEAKGMKIMDVCEVHEALRKCLLINRAQQVICKFNFRNLNIHVLSQNASLRERLSPLVEMELKDNVRVEQSFQSSSSTHETVKSVVSQISGVGVHELDSDSALSSLGIDSMLAMTLQNNIFQETGVNVPLVRILNPHSTLSTVVTFVLNNG
ncbi:phenolphthiocerol/phthiocerol polyketide synthase subunit C isoform X2 [Betta splendens]|uniref:Phenolphthiocerol/phthiocerol polyketide synthase subunit C isoform X2 n=1 Tax=Betta splendens TaxID=158456 RepID=A0A6P7MAI0_BETSP|nr:phenolphthiocerol/phthiocerol polyketide synthase subunit C isoform X2 [Betta splendens]XP_029003203.1 phenolphthiocerol/phthiocerol polyketide synthase subunit C isoform X2 [Betta splendens]